MRKINYRAATKTPLLPSVDKPKEGRGSENGADDDDSDVDSDDSVDEDRKGRRRDVAREREGSGWKEWKLCRLVSRLND